MKNKAKTVGGVISLFSGESASEESSLDFLRELGVKTLARGLGRDQVVIPAATLIGLVDSIRAAQKKAAKKERI